MSDQPPPTIDYASPRPPDDWTTAKTYLNPLEAELAAAALRRAGIVCQVFGATANATLGIYGPGVAKIEVQVPAAEAEAAKLMLDAIEEKRRERMRPKVLCPKCNGLPVRRTPREKQLLWGGMFVFLLLVILLKNSFFCLGSALCLLLAVFYPVTPAWQCKECLNYWRAPEPEESDED